MAAGSTRHIEPLLPAAVAAAEQIPDRLRLQITAAPPRPLQLLAPVTWRPPQSAVVVSTRPREFYVVQTPLRRAQLPPQVVRFGGAAGTVTTLAPEHLTHTRAIYAISLDGTILPAALTHTRAIPAPQVSPQLRPGALTHSRAIFSPSIAGGSAVLLPDALTHTRATPAPKVSPQLRPGHLTHEGVTVTFSIAQSDHDGDVLAVGATWPPPPFSFDTTAVVVEATKVVTFSPSYVVECGLFRWDTSAIPDGATITAAYFEFVVTDTTDEEGRNVVFEWYEPGTIGTDDYALDVGTTAHAGVSPSAFPIFGDTYQLPLLNPDANISKTGFTGLRMGIEGGEPLAETDIQIASYDNTVYHEPRLVVSYVGAGGGRAIYTPTVRITVKPAALTHTRAIFTPNVVRGITPAMLTHTRATPAPKVNVRIFTAALTHTRAINSILVSDGSAPVQAEFRPYHKGKHER